jgi:hypothetical protein
LPKAKQLCIKYNIHFAKTCKNKKDTKKHMRMFTSPEVRMGMESWSNGNGKEQFWEEGIK